jgi:hypothetical protein
MLFRTFDDRIIIETLSNETTTTNQYIVQVVQGVYPIQLLHGINNGQTSCSLQYMSDTMPLQPIAAPDATCCAQHVAGSPYVINVRPSSPCAALSVISAATSLWTAGVVGTVDISMKDLYGNFVDTLENRWHMLMLSSGPVAIKEFSRVAIYSGAQFYSSSRFDLHLILFQEQLVGDLMQQPP